MTDSFLFSTRQWLRLAGPDAAAFAHAQFCNDVRALAPGQWQYGGWLDAKGRVLALFECLCLAPDHYALRLRGGEAAPFAQGLQRYVFRSKVKIAVQAPDIPVALFPDGTFATAESGDDGTLPAADALAEIRAGLPRLPVALAGELLTAWLDFERLGAISFKKGCYPGQEIAARMYFRGGNSRRLHPVAVHTEVHPTAAVLRGADGQEAGRVIQAVASGPGRYEALAVLRDNMAEAALHGEGDAAARIEVLSAQWSAQA